jgi:hypothetical protein
VQPPVQSPPEDTTAAPLSAPISPEANLTDREVPAPSTPLLNKALRPGKKAEAKTQPTLVAPANNVSPATAGIGGRLISADDPEGRRAEAELEGTALDKEARADVPAPAPAAAAGGWWCMFGAFALGSTGGVFAGLAEVQEDKAQRLAITLDADTGGQAAVYGDVRNEYDDILRVGRATPISQGLPRRQRRLPGRRRSSSSSCTPTRAARPGPPACAPRPAASRSASSHPRPIAPPRVLVLAMSWPWLGAGLGACFNAPADDVLFACDDDEAPALPGRLHLRGRRLLPPRRQRHRRAPRRAAARRRTGDRGDE